MAQQSTYLEEFIDDISMLPKEVKRNFHLMRELDEVSVNIATELRELRRNYLERAKVRLCEKPAVVKNVRKGRSRSSGGHGTRGKSGKDKEAEAKELVRDAKALAYIEKKQEDAVAKAEEKILIATQTYNLVDRAIQNLDKKLITFEKDLQRGEYEGDSSNQQEYGIEGDEGQNSGRNVGDNGYSGSIRGLKRPRPGSSWEGLGGQLRGMPEGSGVSVSSSGANSANGESSRKNGAIHQEGSGASAYKQYGGRNASNQGGMYSVFGGHAPYRDIDQQGRLLAGTYGNVSSESGNFATDMPIDPNEPTYCFCNRVSFGKMVGCDNDDCEIEWFHYDCVGLTEPPKGKWYCPKCTALQHEATMAATNKRKKARR
eukprot:g2774.t1